MAITVGAPFLEGMVQSDTQVKSDIWRLANNSCGLYRGSLKPTNCYGYVTVIYKIWICPSPKNLPKQKKKNCSKKKKWLTFANTKSKLTASLSLLQTIADSHMRSKLYLENFRKEHTTFRSKSTIQYSFDMDESKKVGSSEKLVCSFGNPFIWRVWPPAHFGLIEHNVAAEAYCQRDWNRMPPHWSFLQPSRKRIRGHRAATFSKILDSSMQNRTVSCRGPFCNRLNFDCGCIMSWFLLIQKQCFLAKYF